jgi:GNAT superfamily N-acetyltransferase
VTYRIREVDGEEKSDVLRKLHTHCFQDTAGQPDYTFGRWWLAYNDNDPVGFAGMTPSSLGPNIGYLKRAGVVKSHRGHGLQRRLIRVREARARRLGWERMITDCTGNPRSANNLYTAGYRMFEPRYEWAFASSLYWDKRLLTAND